MDYLLLLVGFLLLIKGADLFVDGAASIARRVGIPSVIVGLTIVSLGTSAPELAVSITASLGGSNELTMGNVLGSNLFNTLTVLGCMALMSPVLIEKMKIKKELLVNLGATIVLYFLVFSRIIGNNTLSRVDGLLLFTLCVSYIVYLIYSVKKSNRESNEVIETATVDEVAMDVVSGDETITLGKSILISIVGVAGIIIGGNLVVNSASSIAMTFGLSEKLVGLTIVAIGTSLPELVTSLVAARKGENDLALGNILGSNTFNILLILGTASLISPMAISATLVVDLLFLIAITVLIALLVFMNKKDVKKLNRYEGAMLLALYIGYTVFIIMRN